MNDYYVYLITDNMGVPVYVGMGRGRRANLSRRRNAKINALITFGGTLPPVKVRTGLTQAEAHEVEKSLIAYHGRECDGGTLLNMALGGPGVPGVIPSAATRAKMAASNIGQKRSAETRARMSKEKTGCMLSAETKAKIAVAQKGKPKSAEHRGKLATILAERNRTPEARAVCSATHKGKVVSAETRAKIAAANLAYRAAKRAAA